MDRIRRIAMEILEKYKEKFGTDFVENKKILNTISIVRSKGLKNELAGYITKLIKREIQMAQEEKIANEHAKESEQEGRSEILQPNLQIDES